MTPEIYRRLVAMRIAGKIQRIYSSRNAVTVWIDWTPVLMSFAECEQFVGLRSRRSNLGSGLRHVASRRQRYLLETARDEITQNESGQER